MAFHVVQTASSKNVFNDTFMKTQFKKWDMVKMQFHMFRYTKYFHKMQAQELVLELLNDENAQQVLKVLLKSGEWLALSEPITKVDVDIVPCSLVRMDLFDKLMSADPPIVRATGDLVKCMDDQRDGFQVSDNLRQLLLCDDSENAELYSEEEKAEFLWLIFQHLCLGGACCQFEDSLEPYLDTAKKIYKEMLSVQKNTSSGNIEVSSVVYRIKSIESQSGTISLFPKPSRNNFCYISVDPLRRVVRFWYHGMMPFW